MTEKASPKKSWRLWKKKKANPTGEMSLVEHLRELRRRLIICVIAIIIGTIIGFIWYQWAPGNLSTLGEIMRGPYCSLPAERRADFTGDGECRLLATSPFEMFLLRMKVGAIAGLVFASPVWLSQVWGFLVPGLHKNEKRWTFGVVSVAVLLFIVGAVLAYTVISFGLEFLLSLGDEAQVAALTGADYFNFVLAMVIIFGVSFELPLFVIMLNAIDLLHYDAIKGRRSYIIIAVFIFAAFMTPGGDPFSMVILASSVYLLVELAFQFCRINDRRRGYHKMADWDDLDDEQASELDYTPAPVAPAEPIDAPKRDNSQNFDDVL